MSDSSAPSINKETMSEEEILEKIEGLRHLEPLASLSDNHVREVLTHAYELTVDQGKMLFKRRENSKFYYYLLEGSVDLLDSQYQVEPISSDEERAMQPLDNNDPYIYSAVTTSSASILKLSRDRLDLVLTWDQAGNYLVEEFDEKQTALDNDWMSSLLGSPIFQQIPPANLQQLFVKFKEVSFPVGSRVINEGDPGDDFFVIKSGKADVIKLKEGEKIKVAELVPGQYFGEEALIGNTVRNASVEMSVTGTLMKLGKDDFKQLLETPVVSFITEGQLSELLSSDQNVTFLDIRLPVEIPQNEKDNRLIVPLANLRSRLDMLDEEVIYVIYPEAGERRATLGAYLLNQAGYHAVVLNRRNTQS